MFVFNCVKKFFYLASLVASACQITPVDDLATSSSSSSSVNTSVNKTSPTQFLPHPIFSSILPTLKSKTKLSIRLPAYIPELGLSNSGMYAIIENATASEYQIMLAFTENCTGGTACRLGYISAAANTAKAPPLIGKAVPLAEGITGYFIDATCGANCSDATLVWEQNSVRYKVAIKAGKLTTLTKMANSAY
jgi:hypothetical protein